MKKKSIITVLSLAVILLLAMGSIAFVVTSEISKNRISSSNVKVELVMLEDDGNGAEKPVSGDTKIVPGETKSRIAKVKNTGKEPAWVRVNAKFLISGDEEEYSAIETPYSHLEGLDIEENWSWGEDGYFYYRKALEPGKTTEALFTGITFRPDSIDEENGTGINLKVDAEGVQVKNNGSSAETAKGWPEA